MFASLNGLGVCLRLLWSLRRPTGLDFPAAQQQATVAQRPTLERIGLERALDGILVHAASGRSQRCAIISLNQTRRPCIRWAARTTEERAHSGPIWANSPYLSKPSMPPKRWATPRCASAPNAHVSDPPRRRQTAPPYGEPGCVRYTFLRTVWYSSGSRHPCRGAA